jgi:rod shape-determining protein MreD
MKKIFFHVILFITGLVLQFSFNQYFAVFGIAPNFILILVVFMSLTRGSLAGQTFGFFWGLSWDVYSVKLFGCHAFVFTCIGYFLGLLSKKWDENKLSTQMFLTFMASIIYWTAMVLLYQFFGEGKMQLNYILIIQPVVNTLLAPLIFQVCILVVDYFYVYPRKY